MPSHKIDLAEQWEQFIETGVTSGRIRNPSEIVCEGLRLFEQREQADTAKLESLRAAALQGFKEIEAFVDQVRQDTLDKLATE
jgi:antitoxin ParD1/3/4